MTRIAAMLSALLLALTLALAAPGALAEVRFGKNVRIGGHDVSNQTFNAKRRGEYHIYGGKPKKEGCTWRENRDGSKTKVCHLKWEKRKGR